MPAPQRSTRRLTITLAISVVTLSAGAFIFYGLRPRPVPAVEAAPIRSIAVLPLKNLSDNAANEYFSDGMTESLISSLSNIDGPKVISRGSVFRFKGQEIDPREVGKQLGVAALLEGSVRRDENSVRVTVRFWSFPSANPSRPI